MEALVAPEVERGCPWGYRKTCARGLLAVRGCNHRAAIGLFSGSLVDLPPVQLVEKGLVADVQPASRFLTIPVHFVQSIEDQFSLGFLRCARCHLFEGNIGGMFGFGRPTGLGR